jgi:hypothetical protein
LFLIITNSYGQNHFTNCSTTFQSAVGLRRLGQRESIPNDNFDLALANEVQHFTGPHRKFLPVGDVMTQARPSQEKGALLVEDLWIEWLDRTA